MLQYSIFPLTTSIFVLCFTTCSRADNTEVFSVGQPFENLRIRTLNQLMHPLMLVQNASRCIYSVVHSHGYINYNESAKSLTTSLLQTYTPITFYEFANAD